MPRNGLNRVAARLLERGTGTLRVKVCCIASIAEAEMALNAGADALGLVSAMPSGPGVIADADIASIAAWIGHRAPSVLLTSQQTEREITAQLEAVHPAVLQIVDELPRDTRRAVHDWVVSSAIRDTVGIPLFLAGGLRAENVAEAVRTVVPSVWTSAVVCERMGVSTTPSFAPSSPPRAVPIPRPYSAQASMYGWARSV